MLAHIDPCPGMHNDTCGRAPGTVGGGLGGGWSSLGGLACGSFQRRVVDLDLRQVVPGLRCKLFWVHARSKVCRVLRQSSASTLRLASLGFFNVLAQHTNYADTRKHRHKVRIHVPMRPKVSHGQAY